MDPIDFVSLWDTNTLYIIIGQFFAIADIITYRKDN